MNYTINTIKDLPIVAKALLPLIQKCRIATFSGSMGVGKTTFIKTICKELEVEDAVNSPSFSIVNEYVTKTGQTIYHFDFYRLKNIEELFDIGFEEYLDSGNICLIEWPEIIEDYLPLEKLTVRISEIEDGKRVIVAFEILKNDKNKI